MKTLSFTNKNNVVVVGSLRCRIADFADDIVSKCHNTVLICLGNAGLGRGYRSIQDMEIDYLERICQQNDNVVCIIRGSFDNPLYFKEDSRKKYLKGLDDYLKNIFFVDDYDVIATSKGNILCIGGGCDPYLPEGGSFTDPSFTVAEGAPNSGLWFKGQEISRVNLIPAFEKASEDTDDDSVVDTNPFNIWIKSAKPSITLSSLPPSSVCTFLKKPEGVNSRIYEEANFLEGLYDYFSGNGINIKHWYWSADILESSEIEYGGTRFKGISHYEKEEIA